MSSPNRLFTDEELKEFTKDFIELAVEAVDRGEKEKAKQLLQRHQDTKHWIHDHYVFWVTSLLSHIHKKYGEEAAADALKDSYFLPMLGLERARQQLGVKGYIQLWVDCLLRHHSMIPGLKIEEEDDKFVITFGHCGSGGLLIDRYAYGGQMGFGHMKGPGFHTWGETDVPLYCAHCVWVETWSCLLSGEGAQNIVIAKRKLNPGEPCVLYFYKDASKVPDKFKDRIGMNQTYWHEEPKKKV
ncbi:MAG: hypothetical protein AB1640_17470 [bacterium]